MEDSKEVRGEEGIQENSNALLDDHIAIKQEPRDDEEQEVDVLEAELPPNVEVLGVDEELNVALVDDGFVLGCNEEEVESQEIASEVAAPSRLEIHDHSDYYYNESVVEVSVEKSLPLMSFVSDVGDPVVAEFVEHRESFSAEVCLLDLQNSVHVAATLSPCKSPVVAAEEVSEGVTSGALETTVPSQVQIDEQPQEGLIASPHQEVAMEISSEVDPEATLPLIIESPLPDNDDEFTAKNLESVFSSEEEEEDPISFSNCEEVDEKEKPAHESSNSTFAFVLPTPSDDETHGEEQSQVAPTTSVEDQLSPDTDAMSSPSPCCLQLSEEEPEVSQQQPRSVKLDPKFMNELEELVTTSFGSVNIAKKALKDGREYLDKKYQELSSSFAKMDDEMTEDSETMEKVLRSAAEIEDPAKAHLLLERLKACFSGPYHWIEVGAQSRRVTEGLKILKESMTLKKGGIVKIQSIFSHYLRAGSKTPEFGASASSSEAPNFSQTDPFLVTVTEVVDPGEFYILRWCDREERDRLLDTLNNLGPVLEVPERIVKGQMYAALNGAGKWMRATVETTCGTFMVGDGPVESLYECFLPDNGIHERISETKFRLLPDEIKEIPPFAKPCTLNSYFKKQNWSPEATALFRRWTRRSPMDMQVFAQEGGVLNVDIAQIPTFGEEAHIASVRDSLMLSHKPSPVAAPPKKFKPKYDGLRLQSDPPKSSLVNISRVNRPNSIYVQIVDDDLPRYARMQEQLQEEFGNATNASPSYVKDPLVGHPYALQYGARWYRVLVEMGTQQKMAFFVDTGHRLTFQPTMCFHKLPERLMELPAQAVKTQLFSVFPPFKPGGSYGKNNFRDNKYPNEIFPYIRNNFEDKDAVAFFTNWKDGQVGHIAKNAPSELTTSVTLYLRDEKSSVNLLIIRTQMARAGNMQFEHPDHNEVRQRLLPRTQLVTAFAETVDYDPAPSAPPQEEVVESLPTSSLEPIEEHPMSRSISAESFIPIPEAPAAAVEPQELAISNTSNIFADQPAAAVVDALESPPSNISNLFAGLNLEKSADPPLEINKSAATVPEMVIEEATGASGFLQKKVILLNGKLGVIVSERGTQLDDAEITIPVKFHSVASPEEIYIRTMEQTATHIQLGIDMPKYYKQNEAEERKINFDLGFKCAICVDDTWYRAQVVDMDKYPQVEVYLPDKAETHTVQASDIRRLPDHFDKPPQALMRVALYGVFPTSGTKWEPIVSNFIMDRLRGAELITIGCRFHPKGSQLLKVQLVYVYDEEGGPMDVPGLTSINLNEELIEKGFASRTPSIAMARRPLRRLNWITKEQPKVDYRFTAKATWLNRKGEIFLMDVKNEIELERIRKYLTNKYKNTQSTLDDMCCAIGDLCITTYNNDGYWYRAKIRDFLENGDVEVYYADYGTLDKVEKKDIRLNIDLEDVPVQILRCTFHNLRPTGDGSNDWESRIPDLNEIHHLAVEQKFKVHVRAPGPPIQVSLTLNGRKFNKDLVSKNLAEFIEEPKEHKKRNKKGPRKTRDGSN